MKITLIMARPRDVTNIYPPLGILYITAALEDRGHEVKVFDVNPADSDITKDIVDFDPELIGFSMQTPQYELTEGLFLRYKKDPVLKEKRYCLGGMHGITLPEETLRKFGEGMLDFIVLGEGEDTMAEIADNGGDFKNIKGIAYIDKDAQFVQTSPRPLINDLDRLPFPKREALNFTKYLLPPGMIRGHCFDRITTLISGRGCPYNCHFCSGHKIFHQRVRQRSVGNVIEEIESLVNSYNIRGFFDLNDVFTLNREWVLEFCQILRDKKYGLKWACGTRVNLISEELAKEMRSAGCLQMEFGVESGSDRVLEVLNKKTNTKMVENAFAICRKYGIKTAASFMLGCPGEKEEDIVLTCRLAKKIKADYTVFFFLTPFPGTKIYDDAIKNGWITQDSVFTDKWQIRQTEYPVMQINLPLERIKYFRSKFNNRFFWRNYFKRANLKLAGLVGYSFLKHPVSAAMILFSVLRNRRLDAMIEQGFNLYKRDLEAKFAKSDR